MAPRIKTRIAFIGRAMIWSLLLYVTMMLLINWDEVSNAINNKAGITIVEQPASTSPDANSPAALPANISSSANTAKKILNIIKAITGTPSVHQ